MKDFWNFCIFVFIRTFETVKWRCVMRSDMGCKERYRSINISQLQGRINVLNDFKIETYLKGLGRTGCSISTLNSFRQLFVEGPYVFQRHWNCCQNVVCQPFSFVTTRNMNINVFNHFTDSAQASAKDISDLFEVSFSVMFTNVTRLIYVLFVF